MGVRTIGQIGRVIQRAEEIILAVSILIIAALTILNVVCRSLFGFSLAITDEINQFCIIVVCFAGLSYAASKGRHIRMTAIYDSLPARVQKAFMVGITASTSAILFALSWYALRYVLTAYELGGIYPASRMPFWVIYAAAPLGLFSAAVQYGLATARNLTSDETYLSYEIRDEYEEPVALEI